MKCANHPEVDAIGACVKCGKGVCVVCKTMSGEEEIYCLPCAGETFAKPARRPAAEGAPRPARRMLILGIALFAVAVVILIILLTL